MYKELLFLDKTATPHVSKGLEGDFTHTNIGSN